MQRAGGVEMNKRILNRHRTVIKYAEPSSFYVSSCSLNRRQIQQK